MSGTPSCRASDIRDTQRGQSLIDLGVFLRENESHAHRGICGWCRRSTAEVPGRANAGNSVVLRHECWQTAAMFLTIAGSSCSGKTTAVRACAEIEGLV